MADRFTNVILHPHRAQQLRRGDGATWTGTKFLCSWNRLIDALREAKVGIRDDEEVEALEIEDNGISIVVRSKR